MTDTTLETQAYRLYYWPMLPGRGEFVRLILEDAGVPYLDIARLPKEAGGGMERLHEIRRGELSGMLPFAPPILRLGSDSIAQTAVICAFLGGRFGLAPQDELGRLRAAQLQLTIEDVVKEAHDTHHPISVGTYYEDQKDAAIEAAKAFVSGRLPKWLSYFESVIERNEGEWVLGADVSYVDLSLFQLVEGLRHAFPKAMAKAEAPRLFALVENVRQRPHIALYLASERRLPFNEHGIFRYYAELDFEG